MTSQKYTERRQRKGEYTMNNEAVKIQQNRLAKSAEYVSPGT